MYALALPDVLPDVTLPNIQPWAQHYLVTPPEAGNTYINNISIFTVQVNIHDNCSILKGCLNGGFTNLSECLLNRCLVL